MTDLTVAGEPADALVDQPVCLRVEGARPGARVLLATQMTDANGRGWTAQAEFQADSDGVVDVATQPSLGGDYVGTDPMGLFWSATCNRSYDPQPFMMGVDAPIAVTVRATCRHAQNSTTLLRRVLAEGVGRTPVTDNGLFATLYSPSGSTRAPGVVVLGGSGGEPPEDVAALLASHGFVAMALSYFGANGLPPDLLDIPLEYCANAISFLREQPAVGGDPVGILGRSRGAELALLTAVAVPEVAAVVTVVGSGRAWWGLTEQGWSDRPAWTHRGAGITHLAPPRIPTGAGRGGQPFSGTRVFLDLLARSEPGGHGIIPVEQSKAAMLLISGRDDQVWPSTAMSQMVVARRPHGTSHRAYDDAGHLIGYPYLPTTVSAAVHPLTGRYSLFGGSPAGTAAASADSWPYLLRWLRQHLSSASCVS